MGCFKSKEKPVIATTAISAVIPCKFLEPSSLTVFYREADGSFIGMQSKRHKMTPLKQLSLRLSEDLYFLSGGYITSMNYEPERDTYEFRTDILELKKIGRLPEAIHGGTLIFDGKEVWLAGAWTCKTKIIHEDKTPWPFGSGRLQSWQSFQNIEAGSNYTFDLKLKIWTRVDFVVSGDLSLTHLAGPGVCKIMNSMIYVGGYNLRLSEFSTAILELDLKTKTLSRLDYALPEPSEVITCLALRLDEMLILRKGFKPLVLCLEFGTSFSIETDLIDPSLLLRLHTKDLAVYTNAKEAYIINLNNYNVETISFHTATIKPLDQHEEILLESSESEEEDVGLLKNQKKTLRVVDELSDEQSSDE